MKIIDAHIHIGEFGSWEIKGKQVHPFRGREIKDWKDLKDFMEKKEIEGAVVMPHYSPGSKDFPYKLNEKVIEATRNLQNVRGALWVSPEKETTEHLNKTLKMLPQKNIVALKTSPSAWRTGLTPDPGTWSSEERENMEKIIAALKKHKMVLQTHTGTDNSAMSHYLKFIDEYDVPLHFVHMGGSVGGVFALVPRFKEWIDTGRDFYVDTSFVRSFAPSYLAKELGDHPAIERAFFASDTPWGLFESELAKITAMDASDRVKEKILYGNAKRVYF